MREADFEQLMSRLLAQGPPRVWSLLVTIFGDLAVAPDARLSGTCVNALTAAIGIRPEATRVALHRLRKEGWIESQRDGRKSRYGLTVQGRAETNAAWARVYGPAPDKNKVFLVIDDPSSPAEHVDEKTQGSTFLIALRTSLSCENPEQGSKLCTQLHPSDRVPQWVSDKLCPPEVQIASQGLANRLNTVRAEVSTSNLSLLQATAMREVVVHEWRRLILRVPIFPEWLFSERWEGAECRAAVAALLRDLPAPDLSALNTNLDS